MWVYEQSTGRLSLNGNLAGTGYSGNGAGKNNPQMQSVANVGPIPCGVYAIGAPFNSIKHGPFAMPLSPDPTNAMFKRSGFMLHGDSIEHPGCASEGCIIMPLGVRHAVWDSGDRGLTVVSGVILPTDTELST